MNVPDRIRDKKRETELEAVSLKDEHGLYLEILPTGKKVWRMRYWINQKEGVLKLGEYPLT
ncbi:MAG: Arm DNA-binding domain-containing protein, partial [Synergistaceae bacterium]|nr:Arm DNA-binding domain-containing protein [Synergistaceae bacterium]